MIEDIRWKQRFENFERAFILLRSVFEKEGEFSDLEKEGIIQRFEYTFELAWKTLKDYLESSGIILEEVTPKAVIKQAFESKIIKDGELWIEMLIQRNKLSHTYNQDTFNESIELIKSKFISSLDEFYMFLKEKSLD